jgi:hypothetical protein
MSPDRFETDFVICEISTMGIAAHLKKHDCI